MDNLHLASQVQAGATVVPVFNAQFAPNANTAPIRASGLPFSQGRIIPSRAPVFSFQTFFASAWALQETLKVKKHAAFTMYMRNTGTDGEALDTGMRYATATGAEAFAHISGISEGQGGLIVADVEVIVLASGVHNGIADIIVETADQTIPALPTEPAYHVRGPMSVGGTSLPGVVSFSYASGNRVLANEPVDGKTYPQALVYDGGERTISLGMARPVTVATEIGIEGGAVTNALVDIREINRDGVALASGFRFTMANAYAEISPMGASVGAAAQSTLTLTPWNIDRDFDDVIAISTWGV